MDDLHRLEAKGLARAKIRSQRLRISRIRRHTVRGSLALFVVLWGLIFGQLVTGNDPALSAKASRRQTATHTKTNHKPASVEPTGSLLPTEEPETAFESEPEFEEEPIEAEFEEEPVEEVAPEPIEPEIVEPIVTSSS